MLFLRAGRRGLAAGFTAVLLAAAAATASAQGFFLKEIRKDDRIYVFNVAANAERFEKTGEMGVGITRPGTGPNGETVVGDSERALQLFYFKHGIAEAVPDPPPPPPAAPAWRITGLVFGDYYYFSQHHEQKWDSQNGFWLRRAYLTYDHAFGRTIATRLRFEANSNGKLAGGALSPYVKDAYVRWTYSGRQQVTAGIQPTLSFDFVESFWGLRHVEKTPLDLYRWDSSRDFGVTASGPLNQSGTIKYAAQFGNESGSNAEVDKFKALRLAARYETPAGVSVEGYVSQFHRGSDADVLTAQVFAGYRVKQARVGAHYSYQKRRAAEGSVTPDVEQDLVSVFGIYEARPQKLSAFARLDFYTDPCPQCAGIDYLPISTAAKFTTTIAGIEYFVHPSVRFSPNVEWVRYGDPPASSTAAPEDDVVLRATFYWAW
ncbi:MAG: hypothetical protein KBA95_09730 [Acidobacteria bacterium]|nr:hypothetical protein [Acidobacteriota bacterium]